MIATTAISKDLHAIQPHGYVRTVCVGVWVGMEILKRCMPTIPSLHLLLLSVLPPHLFPVKSSSQVSHPMHVSTAAITESPKGTMYWKEEEGREGGEEERGVREERRKEERTDGSLVPLFETL